MQQPNPFPYAPHPPYNQFGAYGFPYHGFPPPLPPGFQPHSFMGHPNMVMPTPHAVPRDDPYDINNASLCRQATRVTKIYTERMLKARSVFRSPPCVDPLLQRLLQDADRSQSSAARDYASAATGGQLGRAIRAGLGGPPARLHGR